MGRDAAGDLLPIPLLSPPSTELIVAWPSFSLNLAWGKGGPSLNLKGEGSDLSRQRKAITFQGVIIRLSYQMCRGPFLRMKRLHKCRGGHCGTGFFSPCSFFFFLYWSEEINGITKVLFSFFDSTLCQIMELAAAYWMITCGKCRERPEPWFSLCLSPVRVQLKDILILCSRSAFRLKVAPIKQIKELLLSFSHSQRL